MFKWLTILAELSLIQYRIHVRFWSFRFYLITLISVSVNKYNGTLWNNHAYQNIWRDQELKQHWQSIYIANWILPRLCWLQSHEWNKLPDVHHQNQCWNLEHCNNNSYGTFPVSYLPYRNKLVWNWIETDFMKNNDSHLIDYMFEIMLHVNLLSKTS
jgi:hypothetical protein